MPADHRPNPRNAGRARRGSRSNRSVQRPRGPDQEDPTEDHVPRGVDESLLIMAMALCTELGHLERGHPVPTGGFSPAADMLSQLPGRAVDCQQPPAGTIRGMIGVLVNRCASTSELPESEIWDYLEGLGLAGRLRD